MTRDPIPVGTAHHRQPSLLAQFDRHENRAIMVRDGRANVGCVHLTSPMVRVCKPKPIGCTPIAPWYLHGPEFHACSPHGAKRNAGAAYQAVREVVSGFRFASSGLPGSTSPTGIAHREKLSTIRAG